MATINYAKKYSGQVVEKFKEGAKSNGVINNDYDFSGAQSVLVYNTSLPTLNDYQRTGNNRYGTLEELDAQEEEMKMTQEKSFTFVVDYSDEDETQGALNAGKALARTIKEVVVPELDRYRFDVMVKNAHTKMESETITKANVYEKITEATEKLDDLEVPQEGRTLLCNPKVYKLIKQCPDIILDTELSDMQRKNGVIAMVDGMDIVKVPTTRFPAGVEFLVAHSYACVAPVKLAVYKIHTNVVGVNGAVAEGLIYHDAFVLEERKKMIVACSNTTIDAEWRAHEILESLPNSEDLKPEHVEKVNELSTLYNQMSPEEKKKLFPDEMVLVEYEFACDRIEKAQPIVDAIEALPNVSTITKEDAPKVQEARELYDKVVAETKGADKYVVNYNKLEILEAKLEEITTLTEKPKRTRKPKKDQ